MRLDHTPLRILTDGRGDKGAGTGVGGTSRQNKGIVGQILVNVNGLTGQRTLVELETIARQQDTIAWDLVTGLDANQITDDDITDRNLLRNTVPNDEGVDIVVFLRKRLELTLLLVIVNGRNDGHDEDGGQDGNSLNVSSSGVV